MTMIDNDMNDDGNIDDDVDDNVIIYDGDGNDDGDDVIDDYIYDCETTIQPRDVDYIFSNHIEMPYLNFPFKYFNFT